MAPFPVAPAWVHTQLQAGLVIPAHPLALTADRRFDERRQAALTRYYHAAGAGGLAVGVHTTQFEIREHGLYEPVLRLAAHTLEACDAATGRRTVRIAGLSGRTAQARHEAALARELGYHAGLLSLAALHAVDVDDLLAHCQAVAREIPLFGFYLQTAVGGRPLPYAFWRALAELPNLVAIKIAPFNRYQTLEVVRAVAESSRPREIALYTGNDDNIVADLLTRFQVETPAGPVTLAIAGGLLGHWACWTRTAVDIFERLQAARSQPNLPAELLTLGAQITDCNSAFFDAAHQFRGSIAGIQTVLLRQGLLASNTCLSLEERLSPGQGDEIDRVYRQYPHLNDDAFVAAGLEGWLA